MLRQNTNLRKAALFVASLDRENAETVLRQLPSDQAALVRRAAAGLEEIDPEEQEAVIAEFFRIGPMPAAPAVPPARSHARRPEPIAPLSNPRLPGIELDGSLASRFSPPRAVASPTAQLAPLFRCLEEADGRTLAPLLENEQPQTIAVVLSHLPHGKAAQMVMALSPELQVKVLQRLADLDAMDSESLQEIERHLEVCMSRQLHHRAVRDAGLSAVASILQAAGEPGRERLVSNLRRRDGMFAQRLAEPRRPLPHQATFSPPVARQPAALRFENLTKLEDAALSAVVHAADPELTLLALAGVDARALDRWLRQLAPHEASAVRRDLKQLGPTRLSDVEAAQQEIVLVAQELLEAGRIRLQPGLLSMAA